LQYKILASLKEDMNQGWVWLTYPLTDSRSIVEIELRETSRSVYCEALMIDHNYKNAYKIGFTHELPENEAVITINSWYRKKLGIKETNKDYLLSVRPSNHLLGKFMACIQHPQVVVRVAAWLGVCSLSLGLVSIGVAVCA